MNIITLDPTAETPKVILDKENSIFELSGNSLPENVGEFYRPILEWLDTYVQSPNKSTLFNLRLDYYNTSSSKMILKILEHFREIHRKGYEVLIAWHYQEDDEDMIEAGENYAEYLKIPFKFIVTEEES